MQQDDLDPANDPFGGDALLRECIEEALAPYDSGLSAAERAELREHFTLLAKTHPALEGLYKRLKYRPTPVQSGAEAEQDQRPAGRGKQSTG